MPIIMMFYDYQATWYVVLFKGDDSRPVRYDIAVRYIVSH